MKWFVVLLLIGHFCFADEDIFAAEELPANIKYALDAIKKEKILEHAKTLSSPKFQGRHPGSIGGRLSAAYITEQFRQIGLLPGGNAGSYFRTFKIQMGYKVSSEMEINLGEKRLNDFVRNKDYSIIHLPSKEVELSAPLAIAGYGICAPVLGFDEYKDIDVKGKTVVVFSGVPWKRETRDWLQKIPGYIDFDTIEYKISNAEKHGASGVLIVDNPIGWRKELRIAEQLRIPDAGFPLKSTIPALHITREVLTKISMMSSQELRLLALDIANDRRPQSMTLGGRSIHFKASLSGQAWIARNIIGVIPGRDEKLKHEAIVMGAHYDHLGEGLDYSIFFGANDNAAGVGALINIAGAFAMLPKSPKRTMVFILFDAEEIGKLGSHSYVKNPIIPIEKTALMINFDMIGRNEKNHIFAVATRSSDQLHEIHQKANKYVGLDIEHPLSFRLGRSDHTYFYYSGVPVMYLFGGLDPDYHKPTDTWEKLIPEKTEKVARLAFLTAYAIAEREQKIEFRKESQDE